MIFKNTYDKTHKYFTRNKTLQHIDKYNILLRKAIKKLTYVNEEDNVND